MPILTDSRRFCPCSLNSFRAVYMKWAIGALVLVQVAAASLRFLCLSQNNAYKLPLNGRTLTFFALNCALLAPTLFMGLFLKNDVCGMIIKLLYATAACLVLFFCEVNHRTHTKFTRRARAVYAINLCAAFICIALIASLVPEERIAVAASSGAGMCAPVFTLLACLVSNPHFEKKNAKFVAEQCGHLRESNAIKIGITGSYGKTSCKNILYAMLSRKYLVAVTDRNFNTPMGIAITAEKMTGREEIFIAEMGARRRGDISLLADLVQPDYSITTGVCAQHLGTFKSLHNIYLEKSELSRRTKTASFFNCNDKYALKMYKECKGRKIKVCCNKSGDVYATDLTTDCRGSSFTLCYGDDTLVLQTRLLGKHNVINIALCAALALELGVDREAIRDAVKELKPVPHRLEYIYSNGIHILDDSYNSNPLGVRCALEVLDDFDARRVVLSQGIVEGGKRSAELNARVGRELARHADCVILVGRNARYVGRGLEQAGYKGEVVRFRDLKGAQKHFKEILRTGDALLLQNDLPDVY